MVHPRAWRRALLAGAIVCPFLAGCPKPAPKAVKHVVLLSIDTQRADRLGCYGYPRPLSPAIDALAQESVLFEHCAAQASWTSPSMLSMFTGCYVSAELMNIPPEVTPLGECFRNAGWKTGGFVCNNILSPNKDGDPGFDRGFEVYEGQLEPYGSNAPILEWLRAHKDERSFTWIHLNEDHDELVDGWSAYRPQPEQTWRKYRDVREPFAPERLSYYDGLSQSLKLVEREKSLERMQEEAGSYEDEVRCEDARVGEILRELKSLGMWEDTLLVLCADHGEGLFTHEQYYSGTRKRAAEEGQPPTLFNTLQMTHGSQVYRELIHVPLIVHAPGIQAARVAGWVENVDIAPTLLALAGIPPLAQHQGQSLVPLLADPRDTDALAPAVFTHSRYNDSIIDQESFQLIQVSEVGKCDFDLPNQLYDLRRDPEERRNLIGREPERERRLSQLGQRRAKEGLGGTVGKLSPATVRQLESLGYLGGTVEDRAKEFEPKSSAELLGLVEKLASNCFARRAVAKVLEARALSAEEREAVQNWLAHEGSPAVREILQRILAKK